MKISVNAIRAFNERYGCAGDPALDGVEVLVERIGAQLAAVEEVVAIGKKYADVIIVRIVDCRKHENSDHLSICTIDDGFNTRANISLDNSSNTPDVKRDGNGYVQVVCGAPNVRAGMLVAWLPPGSTVPSSYDTDPFVLSVRELRGEVSHGMLASPQELALGDNHDGILEIDEEVAPGTMFADKYGLRDDVVIDMENKMFTHRPDCFGILGVAREIAGIQGQKYTSPAWYLADAPVDTSADSSLRIDIRNEVPGLVPRFVAVPMSGITVGPSPVWLQVELSRLGMRPINNVVDLTNYHMLLTGQPLHAYDYDKVVAQDEGADHATIVIRQPNTGETLKLLNGKTIEPRSEAILITSAGRAIGLGGVMGGADTEVDASTRNIILECASFDMYSIRRTSMAHGLFSDAVTRFNKGQSPLQNLAVLGHIIEGLQQIAGGRVAGELVDDNHLESRVMENKALYPDVTIPTAFVTERLGVQLSGEDMAGLLQAVEFDVQLSDNVLTVRAPFWRTDIEIPEDIVEEIGRLYGYDRLPLDLPLRALMPAHKCMPFEKQYYIRNVLKAAGANEVLSYSFVHGNTIDKSEQNKAFAYKLSNALSPDLQYYRLSLTPSLLDKVHANIKSGYDAFAIFEIGKVHAVGETDEDSLPKESNRLACVFVADDKKAQKSYSGAAYYQARKYLSALTQADEVSLMLQPLSQVTNGNGTLLEQLAAPFDASRSAVLIQNDEIVGIVGEYKLSVQKAFKLPRYSAGFELATDSLSSESRTRYVTQSRFPKVSQDISLRVSAGQQYQPLHDVIYQSLHARQPSAKMNFMLTPLDIYQRSDDAENKQVTFRISIASFDKTMTDKEVSVLLDGVAQAAADRFGAVRV